VKFNIHEPDPWPQQRVRAGHKLSVDNGTRMAIVVFYGPDTAKEIAAKKIA
jgi:hypothetical protein